MVVERGVTYLFKILLHIVKQVGSRYVVEI